MNVEIKDMKKLRELTGCSMIQCKMALEKCSSLEVAKEYLYLKGQALYRSKIVNGVKTQWQDVDYIKYAEER